MSEETLKLATDLIFREFQNNLDRVEYEELRDAVAVELEQVARDCSEIAESFGQMHGKRISGAIRAKYGITTHEDKR